MQRTEALPANYLAAFSEQPGYLSFASFGPPSQAVLATFAALMADAAEGAVGSAIAFTARTRGRVRPFPV